MYPTRSVFLLNKICTQCKSIFECEASTTCWCMNLTKIPQCDINKDKDCLCKNCLAKKIENK